MAEYAHAGRKGSCASLTLGAGGVNHLTRTLDQDSVDVARAVGRALRRPDCSNAELNILARKGQHRDLKTAMYENNYL